MCLLETKTIFSEHDQYRKQFNFPYQYWSSSNSHISGISVLSEFEAISVQHGLNFHSRGRLLTLEFEDFFLCVCYCKLSKNKEEIGKRVEWDKELRNFVEELKKNKKVIWAGDFNVAADERDVNVTGKVIGTSKKLRKSLQMGLGLGFVDSFRKTRGDEKKYSWRSARTPGLSNMRHWKTRIDLILIDQRLEKGLINAEVHDDIKKVSDHCPISIKINLLAI